MSNLIWVKILTNAAYANENDLNNIKNVWISGINDVDGMIILISIEPE